MALTGRQEAVKARVAREYGGWDPAWEPVLRLDADFLLAYLRLADVPRRHDRLGPRVRELVALAVDANATHLHLPGVRRHVRRALELGVPGEQVMEVLELCATLGIHAMNVGVPVLTEVLRERGLRAGPAPLTERQEEIRAEFTANRGYWNAFWDEMLELDPELFAAYTEFSSVPWRSGTLEPKVREFVYVAFDTAATHLYATGLKAHIENALDLGATPGELLEVMEIAAALGMNAVTAAAPVLEDELRAAARRDAAGRPGPAAS